MREQVVVQHLRVRIGSPQRILPLLLVIVTTIPIISAFHVVTNKQRVGSVFTEKAAENRITERVVDASLSSTIRLHSSSVDVQQVELSKESPIVKNTLGLLTFDLDDTIYPLDKVINEANAAFARAMETYGFSGIKPSDITERSIKIRQEMDPEQAKIITHTQLRKLAIRAEMEQVMLQRKLEETAVDWATNVESLGKIVVENAKKWSTKAVSSSIVDAVLTAWEMERHHAAERHLYPEVIPALKAIKREYPHVVIGAVTDGKANPLFMTFTLGKYFDFCTNWEDDQMGRRKFFQELSKVEGNAELTWIYNTAFEKGKDMAQANAAIKEAVKTKSGDTATATTDSSTVLPKLGEPGCFWIHVGDDLAYDVGGSAQCGAKTVLVELADKYGQTARHRFDSKSYKNQPSWSTSTKEELEKRAVMNEAAQEFVNEKLEYWHLLPEVVNKIVQEADGNDWKVNGGSA